MLGVCFGKGIRKRHNIVSFFVDTHSDTFDFHVCTMASFNLIEAFQEFKDAEKIDRPTMMKIIQELFVTLIKRKYGSEKYFEIIVNPDKGDLEIFKKILVVATPDDIDNPNFQVAYEDAVQVDPDCQIGEEIYEEVDISEFGRRSITVAKQLLNAKLGDLKKTSLYEKYKARAGGIITAEVYQVWKKEILLLDDENNDLVLPKSEQIPGDFFKKGDIVKAVLKRADFKNSNPVIILSRTHPELLHRLLEFEVPEILDGLIVIRKIVREPGKRSKVAVESLDDRIDPVGACVGMKGSRIHGIVRELRNENIDIINWTTNPRLFIQRSLSPARITEMKVNVEAKKAEVYVHHDDIYMVIGRDGVNIRLACALTGFDINVYRDDEELEVDIKLEEFTDEIEQWVIDEFKKIGCDTARSIINLSDEDLERRTDLERETISEVKKILSEELEKE